MAKKNSRANENVVARVVERAAELVSEAGDRVAAFTEQALSQTASVAKTAGNTAAEQLRPTKRGATTVGTVVTSVARTAADQNRRLAKAEANMVERAAEKTTEVARQARTTVSNATKRVGGAARQVTRDASKTATKARRTATKTAKSAAKKVERTAQKTARNASKAVRQTAGAARSVAKGGSKGGSKKRAKSGAATQRAKKR